MKTRILTIIAIVVIVSLSAPLSGLVLKPASAHITKAFGNYLVEVGWLNEPPMTGQVNDVIVVVVKGTHLDSGKPVINALANMQLSIKYGNAVKQLDFLPSTTTNGEYDATVIPTKTGQYSLVFSGKVEDQDVNGEIPLDEVLSSDTLNFPQAGGSTTDTGLQDISSKLGTIINQLTSDINDAKSSADAAAKGYADVSKSFGDVKDTTDRLYMISLSGIGIGAAGIVIAVVAITRNKQQS